MFFVGFKVTIDCVNLVLHLVCESLLGGVRRREIKVYGNR